MRHLFWSDATLVRPRLNINAASASEESHAPSRQEVQPTPFRFQMALSFHFVQGSLQEVERCSLHVVEVAFPAGARQ